MPEAMETRATAAAEWTWSFKSGRQNEREADSLMAAASLFMSGTYVLMPRNPPLTGDHSGHRVASPGFQSQGVSFPV